MEEALIRLCGAIGVPAGRICGLTGVWCGLAAARTAALDESRGATKQASARSAPSAFTSRAASPRTASPSTSPPTCATSQLINPCGITDRPVTSLEMRSARKPRRASHPRSHRPSGRAAVRPGLRRAGAGRRESGRVCALRPPPRQARRTAVPGEDTPLQVPPRGRTRAVVSPRAPRSPAPECPAGGNNAAARRDL